MYNKPPARQQFHLSELIYKQKCCQICFKKHNEAKMILCDRCQDAYHIKCINLSFVPLGTWLCRSCEKDDRTIKENNLMKKKSTPYDKFEQCYKCKQKVHHTFLYECEQEEQQQKLVYQARDIKFVICSYCQRQFHNLCFSQRTNSINCSYCQSQIRQKIPKGHRYYIQFVRQSQAKIVKLGYSQLIAEFEDYDYSESTMAQLHLKPPPQITDWRIIVSYEASLCYALFTRGMTYSQNSVAQFKNFSYISQAHHNSIQTLYRLHKSDENAYETFKKNLQLAYFPPLQVKEDRLKGFYLIATSFIQKDTILAEYTGQILTARESLNMINNDNIFALIRNARSIHSLDIVPNKFASIAIFISGVNNSQKDAQIKQNVRALKFCYKGMCRMIFCALKNIQPYQTLYLNYNGNRAACEYPTNNFVH